MQLGTRFEVVEEKWFKERVERDELNFEVGKGIVVIRFRDLKREDFNVRDFHFQENSMSVKIMRKIYSKIQNQV